MVWSPVDAPEQTGRGTAQINSSKRFAQSIFVLASIRPAFYKPAKEDRLTGRPILVNFCSGLE